MSKPKTSYTPVAKPTTAFSTVAKKATAYDPTEGGNDGGWKLNSTVVTLNSTVYLLSGYTGTVPNQLSNKPATAYTAT